MNGETPAVDVHVEPAPAAEPEDSHEEAHAIAEQTVDEINHDRLTRLEAQNSELLAMVGELRGSLENFGSAFALANHEHERYATHDEVAEAIPPAIEDDAVVIKPPPPPEPTLEPEDELMQEPVEQQTTDEGKPKLVFRL